ncbi:Short-chain dehydrogenase reductase SDR, partial [Rhizopus stolonifer]
AHVDRALADTLQHFNQVVLAGAILCSGVVYPPKSIEGYGPDHALTSYSQFEHIIKINLLGTYCVAQKVANILLNNTPMNQDGERGMLITVSSILGLDGTIVGYGTSKAGVAGLTLPMARELSKFGIRVMSIAPGPFDTPILGRSSVHDVVAPFSLFPHRYGVPQEFTDLVMQIIHNPMLNGTVIRLDGALRS